MLQGSLPCLNAHFTGVTACRIPAKSIRTSSQVAAHPPWRKSSRSRGKDDLSRRSTGRRGRAVRDHGGDGPVGTVRMPWAGPPRLHPGQGEGQSVLILGAGIGDLAAAYILSQYGYKVRILEASSRAGGRQPHRPTRRHRGGAKPEERPHRAGVQVRPGPVRQPGAGTTALSPPSRAGLLPGAGGQARALCDAHHGNLSKSAQGFAGKPVPSDKSRTTPEATSPSCWPRS